MSILTSKLGDSCRSQGVPILGACVLFGGIRHEELVLVSLLEGDCTPTPMWSIRQCHAQRGHWAALLSDGGMDCHTTPPEGGGRLRRDKCSHRAQEISNTPETGSRAPASPENIVEHRVHNGDGLLQASLGPSFPSPEGWSFQPEDRGFTCPHRVSREGVQGWRLRVLVQADLDPLCCPREGGLSSLGS